MTHWRQVATIARWEFGRFIKWRQQFIGILVMLGVGGISAVVGKWVGASRTKQVTVAVIGADQLGFPLPDVAGVTWAPGRYSTRELAEARVRSDSVDGALVVEGEQQVDVIVRRRAAWTERLGPAFNAAHTGAAYARLPLNDAERASLSSRVEVAVRVADGSAGDTRVARLYAIAILTIGLLIVFNGFASLFTGITGEKQQRITEQMLSMVTPQAWMDGKILGLAGVAVVGTAFLVGTGMLAAKLIPLAIGRTLPSLPPLPAELGALGYVVAAVALGTAMWFAFMAAVAATIDDPNSSPRTSLLMLPVLPLGLAFTLVSRADTLVAQVLALVPFTSMAVLPVRLLLTTVPWWEPVVALVLLAAAAWWFRRMAGKIFAAGVLLYGKEPSMRDTLRWIREADAR